MSKLIVAVVMWALSGLALAVEPVAQKTKTKTSAAAHSTAAHVKQPVAKSKPAAPKYYYVRATPLAAPAAVAATAATAAVVSNVNTPAPAVGDVHTGRMVCELGNSVTVTPDPQQPTRFVVQMKKNTYLMTPVETTTGAVRLEDAQAGAMWLQLPNKSMLMNSKLGQRMADECQSEHQVAVAHRMKLDPPPSLLDTPALAKK